MFLDNEDNPEEDEAEGSRDIEAKEPAGEEISGDNTAGPSGQRPMIGCEDFDEEMAAERRVVLGVYVADPTLVGLTSTYVYYNNKRDLCMF